VRPKDLLASAVAYRLFARIIRGNAWSVYLGTYVQPKTGEKVLDLGCGPADMLQSLPPVDYTGVDLNPDYIQSARGRFGDRARFICADACSLELASLAGTFDLVLATGVIHHLDDLQAGRLMDVAYSALGNGGRLVTFDGCRTLKQGRIVKWMLNNDRGKFVRQRHEYERLARTRFGRVDSDIRGDLLRIPYTHCIMTCHKT
jgi:SAM-dependent methyltransferase